jgi:4-hydroxymandelate oxidase
MATRKKNSPPPSAAAAAPIIGLQAAKAPESPVASSPAADAGLADLYDYERAAGERLPAMAWDYLRGGAADELTLRANREAYDRLRLLPRVLVDVSRLDTRVTLLGRELPFPVLLAPAAYQRLLHPDGELAVARGAAAARVPLVASCFASTTIEETAAVAASPLWFQLYINPDRGFTQELVRRVEAAGCAAIVLTVDSPTLGPRYRELRNKFNLPPGIERANLRGLATATGGQRPTENEIYSATLDPKLTWRDVEWLRARTKLPVLLKGILHPDDAARAIEVGAAGVIVSNHGGRNLDTLPATIEALPRIAARIAGRAPVLVDGGIRRGTDILKALALGANAVLIGRPYLWGLAVSGAAGVTRVVNILRREFEMALALTGRPSIAAIDDTVIWR